MHLVTEGYAADRLAGKIKTDSLAGRMTFLTVTNHGKCPFAIVTDTTRFPLLHFRHGVALVTRSGEIHLVMTIGATHHAQMELVAETSACSLERTILHRVAPFAVLLD